MRCPTRQPSDDAADIAENPFPVLGLFFDPTLQGVEPRLISSTTALLGVYRRPSSRASV